MSREWQQKKLKKYVMPDAVYHQSLWAVRDLRRMEQRLDELGKDDGFAVHDHSQGLTDYTSVSHDDLEREILEMRIQKIYDALELVPTEYRFYLLQNIIFREPGRTFPAEWRIWKQKFLFQVAKNLSMI